MARTPSRLFSEKRRDLYFRSGLKHVEGWLVPLSARMIGELATAQDQLGIRGGVGEIGVHHGKLFIVLHLMLREGERSFAIDIFEHQTLNIDRSGHGDKERFLANVSRWAGRSDLIDVITDSSENVLPPRVVEGVGPVRVFSVDGGHTESLTMNDLKLAESTLCEGGVVIVDDYFNYGWPEVSCGVVRYFHESGTKLRPVLICPNKILFSHASHVSSYQDFFLRKFRYAFLKWSTMFGGDILVFDTLGNFPDKWRRRRVQLGDRLRDTPYFTMYKRVTASPAGRTLRLLGRLFP